jgi:hypothetical protein
VRLHHTLGRARVPYKAVPTDATTFLNAEESAAIHDLLLPAITTPAGLLDRNGPAILSAARKLAFGRERRPRSDDIMLSTTRPPVAHGPATGGADE